MGSGVGFTYRPLQTMVPGAWACSVGSASMGHSDQDLLLRAFYWFRAQFVTPSFLFLLGGSCARAVESGLGSRVFREPRVHRSLAFRGVVCY